jgi:8-oxo-dGTP diphosphatase
VTVDLVIFTLLDADLKVLLVRRREPPFRGELALPGGFVRIGDGDLPGEDLDAAAARELTEETGLPARALYLEQLYTFGEVNRDPRGRVITVAYFALVRPDLAPFVVAGGDADAAGWLSVGEALGSSLAFDHRRILEKALARLRQRVGDSAIAFELVPSTFTVAELRAVYDCIEGVENDAGNFRRKFLRLVEDGVLEPAPGKRLTGRKPAAVYRFRRQPRGAAGSEEEIKKHDLENGTVL